MKLLLNRRSMMEEKIEPGMINRFIITTLLMLVAISSTSAHADHIKVFLLGGQSNMGGRADATGLPTRPVNLQQPQADVLFYEGSTLGDLQPRAGDGGFGPEITFGFTLDNALPADHIALVKYAVSGSSLHASWSSSGAGGGAYNSFNTRVGKGLEAIGKAGHTYEIAGMLWTQGEKDASDDRAAAEYQDDLNTFIAAMRSNYGSDLPFFLSRLSNSQTTLGPAGLAAIRTAQQNVAAADDKAYLIDTDGFGVIDGDALHFDAAGQIALGEAFAQSYLSTVPEPTSFTLLALSGLIFMHRRRRFE